MLENYTEEGVRHLIESKVEENVHLDYKAAASLAGTDGKKREISKDVSAFANSDGGQIIYGVKEFDEDALRYLPQRIDPIDRAEFSKEWLEQVIQSRVAPRIQSLRITPIECESGVVYVVDVPRSTRPHQASDKRYYKRLNFEAIPMEDYEISDIRNRQFVVPPLVNIDAEISSSHMVYIVVSNIGNFPALDVTFSLPENILWISPERAIPSLFTQGARVIYPGKTFRFMWNMTSRLFGAHDADALRIDIGVSYTHGQSGTWIDDEFHIDLEAYRSGTTLKTDVERFADVFKENSNKLLREFTKLNQYLATISRISGATGLSVSTLALRNLKAVFSGTDLEKIPARYESEDVFAEVLGIDIELADRISHFFAHGVPATLQEIDGVTPEVIQKLEFYFTFD